MIFQALKCRPDVVGNNVVLSCQVFGRAAKYSLFDPSKEMVFITMDKEEKEKGKAAVDILGNQIGKSGGSWVMQVSSSQG
jgi:ATP/ADP translocase